MSRVKTVLAALALLAIGIVPGIAFGYGQATFGTQWWTQNAPEAKFQEFRQVPQGAYLESFLVRGGDAHWKTTFYGTNALRKDQLLGLNVARGIKWQLDGRWQEIPHNISQVARLGFTQVSPGVFILPDSLQARNQADQNGYKNRMTDFLNAANRVPLGFRTDVGSARLRARPANGWQLEFKGERRDRSGNKPYGATFGFSNAIELVEPIDQQMWNGEAAANYQHGRVSARFSGGYSSFDNHVDVLRWDNPRRLLDQTPGGNVGDASSHGLIDLYPNNRAVRGTAGFVLRLPKAATFSANVGASRLTQNDRWQPFTVNSAIPSAALDALYTSSARSTDAKAIRMNVDSRLAGHVVGNLHGAVRYRQAHYDNQTPVHSFRGFVPYDNAIDPASAVADSVVSTKPYGNDQKVVGADLDYMVGDRVTLDGTFEHRIRTHSEREVEKDKEEYVKLRTGIAATEDVHFEVAVFQGIRVMDHFFLEDYQKAENPDSAFTEQTGLRRYDVANRHQRGVSAAMDFALSERVDLGLDFTHERNRYPESVYGLRSEEVNEGLAQASVKLSKRFDVSGGYGRNLNSTDQKSNETNAAGPPTPDAATDWSARIHDRNDFAFAELGFRATDKFHLAAEYAYSRDQADYDLHNGTSTAQNLPDTFYRRHDATLRANYRLKGGTELGARYLFEQYDVVDFASQGIPLLGLAAGSPTAIYLGDNSLPYHAHVISFVATRRF